MRRMDTGVGRNVATKSWWPRSYVRPNVLPGLACTQCVHQRSRRTHNGAGQPTPSPRREAPPMFPAVLAREAFRKSTLVMGGLLSLVAHLVLAAIVLIPLSGAPMVARAELDGLPPVLTVDDP